MTTMENVLAAHQFNHKGAVCTCSNEVQVGLPCDAQTHPQHVAEVLTAAGFGSLHDAWAEGHESLKNDLAGTPRYGTPGYYETPNPYPKVSET